MTLDEAIQHAEEVADKCALTDGNILCENDHRQLAEWLTDYKRLLEQEPCEDAISRQAVLDMMQMRMSGKELYKVVYELPSVNPQPKTGHCKDCKWWKDSDGVYRRGVRAESSCPFNTKEIYDGDAYCYRFEPQKSEEENDIG